MKHLFVLLQRSGFGILNFVMLLALSALAAKWTWVFITPSPVAMLEEAGNPKRPLDAILADHLLTRKVVLDSPPPDIKLEGVFAAQGNHEGYAIFQSGGKNILVPLTGLVMPGIRLDAIYTDHVVFNREGVKMRLNLEEKSPPLDLRTH